MKERAYSINFIPHKRTSLSVPPVPPCIVYATNKDSAKELAQAIVRDITKSDYMINQYKYIINREV